MVVPTTTFSQGWISARRTFEKCRSHWLYKTVYKFPSRNICRAASHSRTDSAARPKGVRIMNGVTEARRTERHAFQARSAIPHPRRLFFAYFFLTSQKKVCPRSEFRVILVQAPVLHTMREKHPHGQRRADAFLYLISYLESSSMPLRTRAMDSSFPSSEASSVAPPGVDALPDNATRSGQRITEFLTPRSSANATRRA